LVRSIHSRAINRLDPLQGEAGSILADLNRNFRTIGLGEPGLVLEARRHGTVADFMRIAEFVELEQFGRQRFAAGVSLTLVLIDLQPQFGGFRHSTRLPWYRRLRALCGYGGNRAWLRDSTPRDGALFLLL